MAVSGLSPCYECDVLVFLEVVGLQMVLIGESTRANSGIILFFPCVVYYHDLLYDSFLSIDDIDTLTWLCYLLAIE